MVKPVTNVKYAASPSCQSSRRPISAPSPSCNSRTPDMIGHMIRTSRPSAARNRRLSSAGEIWPDGERTRSANRLARIPTVWRLPPDDRVVPSDPFPRPRIRHAVLSLANRRMVSRYWLVRSRHLWTCRFAEPLTQRLEDHVQRRDCEYADEGRGEHAAKDGRANVPPGQLGRADCDNKWQQPEDEGK